MDFRKNKLSHCWTVLKLIKEHIPFHRKTPRESSPITRRAVRSHWWHYTVSLSRSLLLSSLFRLIYLLGQIIDSWIDRYIDRCGVGGGYSEWMWFPTTTTKHQPLDLVRNIKAQECSIYIYHKNWIFIDSLLNHHHLQLLLHLSLCVYSFAM